MSARILVVDASRIVHQTVRLSLSDLAEITAVTTAAEALVVAGPWDVVLVSAELGASLPGLVAELRSASPGLHLMVAVGIMRELDSEIVGRLGPFTELRKPWVSRVFRVEIEELLAKGPAVAPPEPEPANPFGHPNLALESSLAAPLNEEALQAITSPPMPAEFDSPFAAATDLERFDEMPSTREFEGLMSDPVSPMTELQAEAASIASELEAGLSALQASLEDFDDEPLPAEPVDDPPLAAQPVSGTMPPQAARVAPALADRVFEMTTPPGGELHELGEESGHFGEEQTDDHVIADDDAEIEDGEPPVWSADDTGEFEASAEPQFEEPEGDEAESVIAALNALEAAAGVVEASHGLGDRPEVLEALVFDDGDEDQEPAEAGFAVDHEDAPAAEPVVPMSPGLEAAFAALEAEAEPAVAVDAGGFDRADEPAQAIADEDLRAAFGRIEEADPVDVDIPEAVEASAVDPSPFADLFAEPEQAIAPFDAPAAAPDAPTPTFDDAPAATPDAPTPTFDDEPAATPDAPTPTFDDAPETPSPSADSRPEAAVAASPLTPEQWIALRAEVRDTVEAMITELVPVIAERLIQAEIKRLTEGFE